MLPTFDWYFRDSAITTTRTTTFAKGWRVKERRIEGERKKYREIEKETLGRRRRLSPNEEIMRVMKLIGAVSIDTPIAKSRSNYLAMISQGRRNCAWRTQHIYVYLNIIRPMLRQTERKRESEIARERAKRQWEKLEPWLLLNCFKPRLIVMARETFL